MTTTTTPLADALAAAIEAAEAAETAWHECEHEYHALTDDELIAGSTRVPERCEHLLASDAADVAVAAARAAFVGSDEPREWTLIEEGCRYATVTAPSAESALEIARGNVDRANYPCEDDDGNATGGTIWIDIRARCEATDEEDSDTVACEAEEPDCEDGEEHDWQSPIEIVGGIAENPGVWGHGGGVVIHEVCMRCGCERTTDTWAQNPSTGQVMRGNSVSYEVGKYADEIAARRIADRLETLRDALAAAGVEDDAKIAESDASARITLADELEADEIDAIEERLRSALPGPTWLVWQSGDRWLDVGAQ